MNQSLATIITTGMNNPDCSFFVGNMLGQFTTFKIVFIILIFYFAAKTIDRLIIDPLLNYIKLKLFKRLK